MKVSGVPHAALSMRDRRRRPSQDTASTKATLSSSEDLPMREPSPDLADAAAAAAPSPRALSRRWAPKGGRRPSLRKPFKMGVFKSFTLSNHPYDLSNLSGHPREEEVQVQDQAPSPGDAADDLERLLQEELEGDDVLCIKAPLKEAAPQEAQDVHASKLARPSSSKCLVEGRRGSRRLSVGSSDGESMAPSLGTTDHHGLDIDNDLDIGANPHDDMHMSSESLLARLGHNPTPKELDNVAAVRAEEYIHECLFGEDQAESVLDREKWASIPQYSKSELIVRKYLGKGSFSDAFEVTAMVAADGAPTLDELKASRALALSAAAEDAAASMLEEDEPGGLRAASAPPPPTDDIGGQIDALFASQVPEEDEGAMDAHIDAMFDGGNVNQKLLAKQQSDVGPSGLDDLAVPDTIQEDGGDKPLLTKRHSDFHASTTAQGEEFVPEKIADARRPRRARRQTVDAHGVAASFCAGTAGGRRRRQATYAMKCLRPQIRSNAQQFIIGVEDLVHETAMLASLDHPNIIKLHGRAGGGCVSSSFRLSDGYFILLDRLTDTLEDRIGRWRAGSGRVRTPSLSQLRTATSIADALAYLHSKKIVYRDLKPANVGYDSEGRVKLFDFGFAVGLGDGEGSESTKLLFDRAGTPRYMAPEVDLGHGYGLPADVHSFGILLWEIIALKKPFAGIKTPEDFRRLVFEEGARPKLSSHWPQALNDATSSCWCSYPGERPSMEVVKALLEAHVREASSLEQNGRLQRDAAMRKSWVMRRLTG